MTLQGFRRKLKNFTFQRAYKKLAYRIRDNKIWSTRTDLLLSRPAGLPPPEARPFAGEIRAPREEELPACAADFKAPFGWADAQRDILRRRENLALFGWLDGTCVFRCYLQHGGSCSHGGHTVMQFADNESYIGPAFCVPAARRKGFHEAVLRHLCTAFPDRSLYCEVRPDNIPSLRGFYRTGFRPVFRLTVKKRFFRSTLDKIPITEEEAEAMIASARSQNNHHYSYEYNI